MNVAGRYEVVGSRRFRGHDPGSKFTAVLDRHAEARAIGRGDIRRLRRITPSLPPGRYQLPDGWASTKAEEEGSV